MLWPKEAGKFIAERAKDVYISESGVKSCAQVISNAVQEKSLLTDAATQNGVIPLNCGLSIDQLIDWNFLVDSINFSFWTGKNDPKFIIRHKGKDRSGYFGLVLAITRALEEGKPIYDPKYYSKLTMEEARVIFRACKNVEIPLLSERVEVMKEVGNILLDQFDGSFKSIVDLAGGSAMKLVDLVQSHFPCFRDVHMFQGQKVAILKRAQIIVSDLALLFRLKSLPVFSDLNQLTMFADYRVPQSLVHFGVISYSENLMHKLKEDHIFNSGDRQEVEIRGVSIHAVELIVEEMQKILKGRNVVVDHINSATVDYFLWDYRVSNAKNLLSIPFHKVRCIYY